ncbi:sensor histidine kinase [Vibrio sp. AK197]
MKLKNHLALSAITTSTVIVATVLTAIFFLLQTQYQQGLQARGIELAKVLAHDGKIVDAVQAVNQQQPADLYDYIEGIRAQTDASYIVVVDKNGYRLSHPNRERIGQHFIGDDMLPTLNQGITHSSEAKGSLGLAIRNFVPLIHGGEVIGAICVGYLSEKTTRIVMAQYQQIGFMIVLVYVMAITMTLLFLYKMRRTFLDYQPEEIVAKFHQHELILDSIRDGIIALDSNLSITTLNRSASLALPSGTSVTIGTKLSDLAPALAHFVLEHSGGYHQATVAFGKTDYRVHLYPIHRGKTLTGHVVVFFANQSASEVEKELTYLKHYTQLLRSKTHEYSNKLNTLSGFLQMENYQQAVSFIQQESDDYQRVVNGIVHSVHDSALAGLLLGKFNKANDMGVDFQLDDHSHIEQYPKPVSDKLLTMLGNLIDNALLAAWQNRKQRSAQVNVSISDRGQLLKIEVEDSGAGIDHAVAEQIFEFGVSTKQGEEQHGVGLYLVHQLVTYFSASLEWDRSDNDTTVFSIYIDKQVLNQYD